MGDDFNECGDIDAISCACGDYNAFEEHQVFLDHEGDDLGSDDFYDDRDDMEDDFIFEIDW